MAHAVLGLSFTIRKHLNMFKALLFLCLMAIVWRLWLKTKPPQRKGEATSVKAETMLSCCHCQVHFPDNEAVYDAAGRTYCSEAHQRAAQAGHRK